MSQAVAFLRSYKNRNLFRMASKSRFFFYTTKTLVEGAPAERLRGLKGWHTVLKSSAKIRRPTSSAPL